jgi:hypothetical protein
MHTAKHPLVAAMQTFSWDVVGKTKTTENNHHTRAMYPENDYILQLICNIWMAGRLQSIGIPRMFTLNCKAPALQNQFCSL